MNLQKLTRIWMMVCTTIVTVVIIAGAGWFIFEGLWARTLAPPSEAQSCIDGGGMWDDYIKICVKSS